MKKILLIIVLVSVLSFSVDVYFYQTDIRDALSQFAMQEGITIIYSPSLTGFITIELYNTTIEKALDYMLLPLGYYWKKIDNIYFVGTANPNDPNFSLISNKYIIKLSYVTFENVSNALPNVLKNYIYPTASKNELLINAPPKIASQIAEIINLIDKKSHIAEIKIKLYEIDEEDLRKFGVEFSSNDETTTLKVSYNNNALQLSLDLMDTNLFAIISALISSGKAKILTNGTIFLKANESAKISAYTTIDFTLSNDKVIEKKLLNEIEISGTVFVDHVSLNLTARAEALSPSNKTIGLTFSNSLDLKYNKHYYIAGLSFETTNNIESGIPGLKDLPIIGNLFKTNEIKNNKKIIIISLEAKWAGDMK
ncbi:general secretion pathway protein GspD [Thermosipho melanesiensis]|uniref:General secretion pathway protein GspD n=1 Tax=Thermosipho melanesiensis TaxID=46541 RepID=A0ABM6GFQ9_9BACT|nr:secretin and TonB N-terminal domain-containing protein [Thermosipho melanesiensis]APT74196.1 general secretion pathway protein GspD [Thermosipho melanesiensis]OOC36143.1 general secretion pathway protein GspD [Thermosipho melanesiensis]OOC36960.1 general secretion pathway protein GspD [Thermosipho melanesiensis]OOC37712.1 general secretion pathway protein GspD [Thermosipho melanesiensis]OOC40939.1 general secretion pathway protein GspD [Thermosipho melanesiensis]